MVDLIIIILVFAMFGCVKVLLGIEEEKRSTDEDIEYFLSERRKDVDDNYLK